MFFGITGFVEALRRVVAPPTISTLLDWKLYLKETSATPTKSCVGIHHTHSYTREYNGIDMCRGRRRHHMCVRSFVPSSILRWVSLDRPSFALALCSIARLNQHQFLRAPCGVQWRQSAACVGFGRSSFVCYVGVHVLCVRAHTPSSHQSLCSIKELLRFWSFGKPSQWSHCKRTLSLARCICIRDNRQRASHKKTLELPVVVALC